MKQLLRRPWFGPLCALLGVYVLFAVLRPEPFLGIANLELMTRQTVVVALAAGRKSHHHGLAGHELKVGYAQKGLGAQNGEKDVDAK